jgi:hypothetical protein
MDGRHHRRRCPIVAAARGCEIGEGFLGLGGGRLRSRLGEELMSGLVRSSPLMYQEDIIEGTKCYFYHMDAIFRIRVRNCSISITLPCILLKANPQIASPIQSHERYDCHCTQASSSHAYHMNATNVIVRGQLLPYQYIT